MPDDPVQIIVGQLNQLVQPVDQFHIGVSAQLAKGRSRLGTSEKCNCKLAKECLPRNSHSAVLIIYINIRVR
jgi:hypothetical protein